MQKKKIVPLVVAAALLLGVAALVLNGTVGRRPFKDLTAEEIASASVQLLPPDARVEITDLDELAGYLNEVVIYNPDSSYGMYAGQACVFTMVKTDGSVLEVNAFNPFIIIDGTGYRCKYEPCEALNRYANEFLYGK